MRRNGVRGCSLEHRKMLSFLCDKGDGLNARRTGANYCNTFAGKVDTTSWPFARVVHLAAKLLVICKSWFVGRGETTHCRNNKPCANLLALRRSY